MVCARQRSEQLWPHKTLQRYSYAHDLLTRSGDRELRGEVPATAWFDHDVADGYYILEHSPRSGLEDILSLLWWKNEQMLIDVNEHEEKRAARRSDWRENDRRQQKTFARTSLRFLWT